MHIVLSILFYSILSIDIAFVAGLNGYISFPDFIQQNTQYVVGLLFLQFPIFYYIMFRTYIGPLWQLNKNIARFYTGLDEMPNMNIPTWSKSMQNIVTFFHKSLEILQVFKDELRDGRKLRSEVDIASEIQKQSIFQQDDTIPGLTIAVGSEPAAKVGGDSIDIVKGKEGNYYLYIGDVTGHGVASGFVMMMVNALISALAFNKTNGADILATTNTILKPRIKNNMMMTCVLLRWNKITQKMYFTGAGHEQILLYKAQEKKVYKIKTGGVALGMVRDISKVLKEQQIAFEKNDLIILYTDGITEARYRSEPNGILFGVDRLIAAILKPGIVTPEIIFRQITTDLSAFMGYRHMQYDDITLAVIQYNADPNKTTTLTKIPEEISPQNITEWNWGEKHPENI